MRCFGVVLSVFWLLALIKCEEPHHVDQRILENQYDLNRGKENQQSTNSNGSHTDATDPSTSNQTLAVTESTNTINLTSSTSKSSASTKFDVSILLRSGSSETGLSHNNNEMPRKESERPPIINVQENAYKKASQYDEHIDAEVKDLLDEAALKNQDSSIKKELGQRKQIRFSENIDQETELIEDGQNTEDKLRSHNMPMENVSDSPHGLLAIVLVSTFVAATIVCYVGLLLWRKYLENRYGSRTLLVNAEVFDDPNDLRHFTI